jgi:hypothetical protein
LIVQLTALSSEKMPPLQDLLLNRGLLIAPAFPRRPESVFDGVEMPVTILLSRPQKGETCTSRISRFYTQERPHALNVLQLQPHSNRLSGHRIGKIGTAIEVDILHKINSTKSSLALEAVTSSDHILYYQEACRYWVKASNGYPFFKRNGKPMPPPHGRTISFKQKNACALAACLINSSLFYWFYSVFSDCEHINDTLVRNFKTPDTCIDAEWIKYATRLSQSMEKNALRKVINTKEGHKIEYDEMDASKSKQIIDEIDRVLAKHYGFTDEELDFIINYDIKYRMGRDGLSEDEE